MIIFFIDLFAWLFSICSVYKMSENSEKCLLWLQHLKETSSYCSFYSTNSYNLVVKMQLDIYYLLIIYFELWWIRFRLDVWSCKWCETVRTWSDVSLICLSCGCTSIRFLAGLEVKILRLPCCGIDTSLIPSLSGLFSNRTESESLQSTLLSNIVWTNSL